MKERLAVVLLVFAAMLFSPADAGAQSISACWHCARGVDLQTWPFMNAFCCIPGSINQQWADCDDLEEDGYNIFDYILMNCWTRQTDGGHWDCVGDPCDQMTEPLPAIPGVTMPTNVCATDPPAALVTHARYLTRFVP